MDRAKTSQTGCRREMDECSEEELSTVNGDLLKILVGGVVGAHGIGHVMGWLPAWGIAKIEGVSTRSWLLTDTLGERFSGVLGGALWLLPTIGFVTAAAGLFAGQAWWRPLAIGSAVLSLAAIALFWEALPVGSRVGAIGVNLVVVAGLVMAGWPSASSVGA